MTIDIVPMTEAHWPFVREIYGAGNRHSQRDLRDRAAGVGGVGCATLAVVPVGRSSRTAKSWDGPH